MTSNQHCFRVPQCENVRHALFIWGKSYLIYSPPSSSAEAPVCTRPCFIWISKAVRRWPDTLSDIFWGFFWGMWLLKCPRLTNLMAASMQSLWWQPNNNLYLPILCSAEKMDTDLHHSMRPSGLDGTLEISHIFGLRNQRTKKIQLYTPIMYRYLSKCAISSSTHMRNALTSS